MTKKIKKSFFRPIHLGAVILFIVYILVSKVVFFTFVASPNLLISFTGPFVFGVVTALVFMYFFNHQDFFHFVKELEKHEVKEEKKYIQRYKHFGKMAVVIITAIFGGEILAALTLRFLSVKHKYLILIIAMFISTLVNVGFAKGFISFIFR